MRTIDDYWHGDHWTWSFRDLCFSTCSLNYISLFVTCFHQVELVGREKMRRVEESIMKSAAGRWSASTQMIITISWQKRWHYGNYQQQWWKNIIMSIWPMSGIFVIFTSPFDLFFINVNIFIVFIFISPLICFREMWIGKTSWSLLLFLFSQSKVDNDKFWKTLGFGNYRHIFKCKSNISILKSKWLTFIFAPFGWYN